MDRMAAEALSWVADRTAAEAATDGRQLAAATEPTSSKAVGTGIDMTIVARIGTAIGRTPRTVAPAGGGLPRGACGCAAMSARTTAIGTADTAIIVRTAAIIVRPTDVVRPTDTDAGKVVTERDKCGPPKRLPGTPCRGAFTSSDYTHR